MNTGYVLKFHRAAHHLNDLQVKITDWFNDDRCTIINEADPDGPHQRRVRVILKEALPADPFALIVGDILYSLRSCLDNLAFVLNGGPSAAKELANESEFPIFGNEKRSGDSVDGAIAHKGSVEKKIRGMSVAAQAAVKSLQPYVRGDRYREDPLWLLHSLCNADKHRSVHVVASTFGGAVLRNPENIGRCTAWQGYSGALKEETVILRYTLAPRDPDRDVNMDVLPMLDVGITDGASIRPALRMLADIMNYMAPAVVGRLERHLPPEHPCANGKPPSIGGCWGAQKTGPQRPD